MSSDVTYGTNVAPISFPGIVSGIDYTEIIDKLSAMSMVPTTALNAQIATLNDANTELIKIGNMLASVQTALANLSNPDLFSTYQATSGNTEVLTASGISGVTATPGLYTIESVTAATSTSVTSSTSAGHSITDDDSENESLATSYASVAPSNGSTTSNGTVTVDGVTISYNVDDQSLVQILSNITSEVDAKADSGFLATLVNGVVEFKSTDDEQISLGSSEDQGNLLDVLKLSSAQLINSGGVSEITGTSNVGGINPDTSFDATNDAGFVDPVTGGYFTINGVKITVQTDQSLDDVLTEINESSAGVNAVFNSVTNQIVLTNENSGPQSIVLGSSSDTSNFLSAAGLLASTGATTTVGGQSAITVQNPDGTQSTYYGDSNTVTDAIPGISLDITGNTTTPFTVDVTQNTTLLVSSVQAFISTYNAAVNEINTATAAPIVEAAQLGSGGETSTIPGGVLYGNDDLSGMIDQFENILGGFLGDTTSDYNSLSQAGILLNSSFSTVEATSLEDQTSSNDGVEEVNQDGTNGELNPLNVTAFLAAYASNPTAVADLLVGANSLTTQLGSYLTTVTGSPTLLDSGPVGTIPTVSLIDNFENGNNDTIASLQQQVQQITDETNDQANILRSEFVSSETAIAGLQSEQQELAATFGFSTTSTSST